MIAFINIPKKRGSSVCTRNGAILEALRAPTMRTLQNSWQLGSPNECSEIDAMMAARELRERLQLSLDELRDRPHASFADLESSGVFGGLTVLERRGFWRVEYNAL